MPEECVVPCGLKAFAANAAFGGLVFSDQVQGNAIEQREVLGCVSGSFAASIFAKGHVQHPAQFVFDAPVLANRRIEPRRKVYMSIRPGKHHLLSGIESSAQYNLRALARAAGVSTGLAPQLVLPAKPEFALETNAEEIIVFHAWPSGARSWLREWPTQRWVELAQLLVKPGRAFVLTASKDDRPQTLELCAAMQSAAVPAEVFIGTDGLVSVSHLLRRARLLVSVNTGIMHLGAILGTPTVAINGPNAEERWGPIGPKTFKVNTADGSGGFLHLGYEFDGNPTDTMERITMPEVHAAAEHLLLDSSCSSKLC